MDEVPFAAELYNLKGTYFYNFRRYDEALSFLHKAQRQSEIDNALKISVFNTLGLVQRSLENIDSSIYYFEKGLSLAINSKNADWVGVIKGNLGFIYYLKNDLENAKKYLLQDKELSLKNNQPASALNAIAILVDINLKQGDFEFIESDVRLMDSLAEKVVDFQTIRRYYKSKNAVLEAY